MTSIAGMVTWFCIGVMYLRFHKAMKVQGMSRDVLPYQAWLQPFCGWWTVATTSIVMLFSGWSVFLKISEMLGCLTCSSPIMHMLLASLPPHLLGAKKPCAAYPFASPYPHTSNTPETG